jgi:hypothetical protein
MGITTIPSNNFSTPIITLYLMRYTKYFSGVLRHQGVPNLNVEQSSRLMNIVSLEGRIQELLDIKKTINNEVTQDSYGKIVEKKISLEMERLKGRL